MTRAGGLAVAVLIGMGHTVPVLAQPAASAPRVVLSAGGTLFGSDATGARRAELRPNTSGSAPPVVWFAAKSTIEPAVGVEARVDVRLSESLALAVGGTFAKPRLTVAITGDAEAGGVDIVETLSQYTVDLSAVWRLSWRGRPRRIAPYVLGGGGYLRQLHEDRLRVDTGQAVHAGGGLFYALGRSGRPWGVRADGRWVRRTGGVDFSDRARNSVALSLLAYTAF